MATKRKYRKKKKTAWLAGPSSPTAKVTWVTGSTSGISDEKPSLQFVRAKKPGRPTGTYRASDYAAAAIKLKKEGLICKEIANRLVSRYGTKDPRAVQKLIERYSRK